MHPDNPFEKEYNFNGLIQSHPKLSEFIIVGKSDRKSIDFGDSKAIIALNTALLKRTFDVNWELKPGHLCPALPGRLDYLIHVKDLLGACQRKLPARPMRPPVHPQLVLRRHRSHATRAHPQPMPPSPWQRTARNIVRGRGDAPRATRM